MLSGRLSAAVVFASLLCFLTLSYLYFGVSSAIPSLPTKPPLIPSKSHVAIVEPDDGETWPYRVFKSSPLRPPNLTVTWHGEDQGTGDLFIVPKSRSKHGIQDSRPYIISLDNELVFGAETEFGANDLRVQQYGSKPHLTFWQGASTSRPNPGHGYGVVTFLNQSYESFDLDLHAPIRSLLGGRNKPGLIDIHEHEMTDRDTMLVTAYNNTRADLSSVNESRQGWVADSPFFEIDVRTQEVLYTWSPLEHVGLNTSRLPVISYMGNGTQAAPYDFFHTNSVQAVGEDYFLISSRHTWSAYLIAKDTGDVLWELNGEDGGDWASIPDETKFRWQHHARMLEFNDSGANISLFDNHAMKEDPDSKNSSGLLIHLPLPPRASHPPVLLRKQQGGLRGESQGSYNVGPETDLVGYGQSPVAQEFSHNGALIMSARFGYAGSAQNYRAFRQEWHAMPASWDPKLVVEEAVKRGARRTVRAYVSWNGATDVESWHVYATENVRGEEGKSKMIARAVKRGFETAFVVQLGNEDCLVIAAVQGGEEIRRSNLACPVNGGNQR